MLSNKYKRKILKTPRGVILNSFLSQSYLLSTIKTPITDTCSPFKSIIAWVHPIHEFVLVSFLLCFYLKGIKLMQFLKLQKKNIYLALTRSICKFTLSSLVFFSQLFAIRVLQSQVIGSNLFIFSSFFFLLCVVLLFSFKLNSS